MSRSFGKGVDFLEKWLRFAGYHQFIEGVNIIPFKTPLHIRYDHHLLPDEIFRFKNVYDYSIQVHKPITDLIDLTFTRKYYDPRRDNFLPAHVEYHKFMVPGRDMPDKQLMNNIVEKMDELIKGNRVIGIHCTHGINRTGLVVCNFLVTKLGWDPETAIKAFNKARGSDITDQEYIEVILNLKMQELVNKEKEKRSL